MVGGDDDCSNRRSPGGKQRSRIGCRDVVGPADHTVAERCDDGRDSGTTGAVHDCARIDEFDVDPAFNGSIRPPGPPTRRERQPGAGDVDGVDTVDTSTRARESSAGARAR